CRYVSCKATRWVAARVHRCEPTVVGIVGCGRPVPPVGLEPAPAVGPGANACGVVQSAAWLEGHGLPCPCSPRGGADSRLSSRLLAPHPCAVGGPGFVSPKGCGARAFCCTGSVDRAGGLGHFW